MTDDEIRELLDADIEVREAEGAVRLVGYAAKFNSKTQPIKSLNVREMIAPGAFTEALRRTDIDTVALFNHDKNRVLGRKSAGTLDVSQDSIGLRTVIYPPKHEAKLVDSIRRGDIRHQSFRFKVAEGGERWDRDTDGTPLRVIEKVAYLRDVGPQTEAAYEDTDIVVARSLDGFLKEQERAGRDIAETKRLREQLDRLTAK